jgi:hypothetical protein
MRKRFTSFLLAALALAALIACTPQPVAPTPPAGNTTVNVNVNVGNGTTPSPAPGAGAARPDLVKVTQFGETCPSGISPSGQDRAVRNGCSKALTCSPKCKLSDGTFVDCQIPPGAAPDEFRVFVGQDRISFTASGSNPAFNRDARGVAAGLALIDCTYAGMKSEPFDLTVVP